MEVPGRVCLVGEHSDWASSYRRFNADIEKGKKEERAGEYFIILSLLSCFHLSSLSKFGQLCSLTYLIVILFPIAFPFPISLSLSLSTQGFCIISGVSGTLHAYVRSHPSRLIYRSAGDGHVLDIPMNPKVPFFSFFYSFFHTHSITPSHARLLTLTLSHSFTPSDISFQGPAERSGGWTVFQLHRRCGLPSSHTLPREGT